MSKNTLILVLNCGSSSLKGAVLEAESGNVVLNCLAEKLGFADALITFKADGNKHKVMLGGDHNHTVAVEALMVELQALGLHQQIGAVGHRVVHGGERFTGSVLINEQVMHDIEACIVLAPLHNPAQILGIRAAQAVFADLPQVAVFDTAFHQSMPEHAYRYAVSAELYTQYGVRRYGMHGTSYRFVSQESARFLGRPQSELALVIAHLGNGASVTAVLNGQSQDTSMGLTPLEGLVMGTRSGDIDASIFSFLNKNAGMGIDETTALLNYQSGLLGLSGLSNDCRVLEEAAGKGHQGAILALAVFAYRLAKYVAAMAVANGRLDALVFTGGIGENSAFIRERVLTHLAVLGLKTDDDANQKACFGRSGIISQVGAGPLALVIPTNEERMIAQDTARLADLGGAA